MELDTALVFMSGALVGQIVMVIFLNIWEWMQSRTDDMPQPAHPDSQQYWDFDPDTQTYKMRGEA